MLRCRFNLCPNGFASKYPNRFAFGVGQSPPLKGGRNNEFCWLGSPGFTLRLTVTRQKVSLHRTELSDMSTSMVEAHFHAARSQPCCIADSPMPSQDKNCADVALELPSLQTIRDALFWSAWCCAFDILGSPVRAGALEQ
jgi:hypothetical protein